MNKIYTAPIYELKDLNNIFIELTAKNCNHRCSSCYIDFPINKKIIKDFIPLDRIKECLNDIKNKNIHCIYLIGAEPMTHPDFNLILRLSLKVANVCICTNGSFLNEKKIRFLKKVENEIAENPNQIFLKLSLTHFDETENDKIKYRGNFRQTIFALKTSSNYNFTNILTIQNYYLLDETIIYNNLNRIFKEQNITNTDIQIIKSHPNFEEEDYLKISNKTDCMFGRTLTANGLYSCPFLANDYRGRLGQDFKNFSTFITAETDFCATCSNNNNFIFTIN